MHREVSKITLMVPLSDGDQGSGKACQRLPDPFTLLALPSDVNPPILFFSI